MSLSSSSEPEVTLPSRMALNAALEEVRMDYSDIKDGVVLFDRIAGRLRAVYDKPPVTECQQCIRTYLLSNNSDNNGSTTLQDENIFSAADIDRLTLEELREIMFSPSLVHVKYYPLFISPDTFNNDDNGSSLSSSSSSSTGTDSEAQQRIKAIFLTLLFLLHRKHVWFMSEFVLTGGMHALTTLLVDDNIYYRGQAVDTMLTVIDCDAYDWFATPLATERDERLHQKILNILVPPAASAADAPGSSSGNGKASVMESPLIRNLCRNNTNNPTNSASNSSNSSSSNFPGGSLKCLQLLGFFLSWCRRLYTPSQILVLSTPVIQELNAWRRSTVAETATEQVTELSSGEDNEEEMQQAERKFAQELYSDFVHTQFETGDRQSLPGGDNLDYGRFCVFGVDKLIKPTQVYSSRDTTSSRDIGKSDSGIGGSASSIATAAGTSLMSPPTVESILDPVPVPVPTTAVGFKDLGNKHFMKGDFDAALENYMAGWKQLLLSFEREEQEEGRVTGKYISRGGSDLDLQVSLLHNIATVLWKVYKEIKKEEGEGSGHHKQCRQFCTPLSVLYMYMSAAEAEVVVKEAEAEVAGGSDNSSSISSASTSSSSVCQHILQQCERVCRSILALTASSGSHVKATYRLANVLLKLGRPAEGVKLVDIYVQQAQLPSMSTSTGGDAAAAARDVSNNSGSGSGSGSNIHDDDGDGAAADALYTLRSVRRQCVSDILAAEAMTTTAMTDSTAGTSTGTSTDGASVGSSLLSATAKHIPPQSPSQPPLVSDKVSTVMLALRARRDKTKAETEAKALAAANAKAASASASVGVNNGEEGEEYRPPSLPSSSHVKGSLFKFSADMVGIDEDEEDTASMRPGQKQGQGRALTSASLQIDQDLDSDMRAASISTAKVLQQQQQQQRKKKSTKATTSSGNSEKANEIAPTATASSSAKEKKKSTQQRFVIPGLESLGDLSNKNKNKSKSSKSNSNSSSSDLNALMTI